MDSAVITAIIGKSGAGKTTIFHALRYRYAVALEADTVVRRAYREPDTIDFIRDNFSFVVIDGKIDKNELVKTITKSSTKKLKLENYLFKKYFLPVINQCRSENTSLLIDGIISRFTKHFDQIITVNAPENIRIKNLEKRGVSPQRIQEILRLQR